MVSGQRYSEFVSSYAAYQRDHPNQRPGQAFINVLQEVRPDLLTKLMEARLDPFYEPRRKTILLHKAFIFIHEHWND